jgi:hypothetical protein
MNRKKYESLFASYSNTNTNKKSSMSKQQATKIVKQQQPQQQQPQQQVSHTFMSRISQSIYRYPLTLFSPKII